jgi:general secretion pathway protein J
MSRSRISTATRARATTRHSGFTLIEVIIAISLLALGLALSFGTLRGATKATERAENVAQRDERLRAVQGFLRTQINAALPIAFEFESETGEAKFLRASATKLEFVATMPGYLSRGGPYLQTLELVHGGKGEQLVFQHQLLTTDGALDAEREPVVLLDGIEDARFDVRTLDEQSRPGDWQPEWDTSAQLPPLVRLKIDFIDKRRHWPEFVAATRLGVATAAGGNATVRLAAGQEESR